MDTSSEDASDLHDFWKDWDLENLTEAEYLTKVLGPKYLPPKMVIPMTIAYPAIFVTGIFGNITTCIVITRNPSMQTATNYYLFSLAISDLTLLILGESRSHAFTFARIDTVCLLPRPGHVDSLFPRFVKTTYKGRDRR